LTAPTQVLAIPYQDVQTAFLIPGTNTGVESAQVVAAPNSALGLLGGTIDISSHVSFWNFQVVTCLPLLQSDVLKVDTLIGYRHLELDDTLNINTQAGGNFGNIFFLGSALPQGVFTNSTFDSFAATNRFDGAQLGTRATLTTARWSLVGEADIALGSSHRTLNISGSSSLNQLVSPRPTQTAPGGIFALPSNSGTLSSSSFTAIPEMSLTLNFQITQRIRLFAGYNFLSWNNVVRAGDYVNPLIDSRQIPTNANYQAGIAYNGPTPATALIPRGFIAQGVVLGVEFGF
jgi:hypothetical protein